MESFSVVVIDGGEEGVIKGGGANQIVYASACST